MRTYQLKKEGDEKVITPIGTLEPCEAKKHFPKLPKNEEADGHYSESIKRALCINPEDELVVGGKKARKEY